MMCYSDVLFNDTILISTICYAANINIENSSIFCTFQNVEQFFDDTKII